MASRASCRPRSSPSECCRRSAARRSRDGFSSKPVIWPRSSNLRIPICVASFGRDRLRGDRDVGVPLDVGFEELVEVHAVEVVAREDEVIVRVEALEVARRLSHGVRGALEPVRAVGRLLRGEHLHEALREHVEPVGLRDVAVERRGVELGQHEDALEAGVQAVADRDVDQPVLARERHGRLRAHVRQREQARSRGRRRGSGSTRHSWLHLILHGGNAAVVGTLHACVNLGIPAVGRWSALRGHLTVSSIVSRCRCRTPSPPTGRQRRFT